MGKKIVFLVFFSLFMAFIPAAVAEPDVRAARVSLLKGLANNTTTGKPLKLYDSVMKGDILSVPASSTVRLIFYTDYHEEELRGTCTARIEERGIALVRGDKTCRKITREPYKSSLSSHMASRGREIAGGASRKVFMNPAKYQVFPVADTLELPKKLTFSWKVAEGVKPAFYRATFSRLEGDKAVKLHSAVVTTTSYVLPDSVKEPESGKSYIFGVEGFLKNPSELGADLPESRVAASAPPYIFTMPARETARFISAQEQLIKKLTVGSDAWNSYALFLFSLYLEYGADDRAAALAKQLAARGKESELSGSNSYLKGLMESFGK